MSDPNPSPFDPIAVIDPPPTERPALPPMPASMFPRRTLDPLPPRPAPVPPPRMVVEPPKVTESAKLEPAKIDPPKIETPKAEVPKIELPKAEAPKVELPKMEVPRVELPKVEAPKIEPPKSVVRPELKPVPAPVPVPPPEDLISLVNAEKPSSLVGAPAPEPRWVKDAAKDLARPSKKFAITAGVLSLVGGAAALNFAFPNLIRPATPPAATKPHEEMPPAFAAAPTRVRAQEPPTEPRVTPTKPDLPPPVKLPDLAPVPTLPDVPEPKLPASAPPAPVLDFAPPVVIQAQAKEPAAPVIPTPTPVIPTPTPVIPDMKPPALPTVTPTVPDIKPVVPTQTPVPVPSPIPLPVPEPLPIPAPVVTPKPELPKPEPKPLPKPEPIVFPPVMPVEPPKPLSTPDPLPTPKPTPVPGPLPTPEPSPFRPVGSGPKPELPKPESTKPELPKPEALKPELPKTELPKFETPPPVKPTVQPVANTEAPRTDFDVDLHEPRSGETYESISKQFYGDTKYAEALKAFNANRQLGAGGSVQVPPMYVLRKKFTGLLSARPASQPAPIEVNRPAVEWKAGSNPAGYATPRAGMTLWDVAEDVFGDRKQWQRVWDANPRLDPNSPLPAGTSLLLPSDARAGR